jgi:hypothetical protein
MDWQEYQEAVGKLYTRLESMGTIQKNIYRPDKITGQKRQIDVWWEVNLGDHQINVLVDAKLKSRSIDIHDVDRVAALANAVNANKAIIVTNNGWTQPAKKKAEFIGMDVRILSIEEALDLVIPNKWMMCYECDECVVMDMDGILYLEKDELFFDWYAGRCRECKNLYLYCPQCGSRTIIEDSDPWKCNCAHTWKYKADQLLLKFKGKRVFLRIDNATKVSAEFLYWLEGNDPKYWAEVLVGKVMTIGTDTGGFYHFEVTPPA